MTPLQAIEALSSALGVRIRAVARPALFEFFATLVERLDTIAIDERAHATGDDHLETACHVDGQGRVTALFLNAPGEFPGECLEPMRHLVDLELLAVVTVELGPAQARLLSALPRLRLLATRLQGETASETLAALAQAQALEGLLVMGQEDAAIDLLPLTRLTRLRSFACLQFRQLQHFSALGQCAALRSLALHANGLRETAAWQGLSRLELLYVLGGDEASELAVLAALPGLRSLHLDSLAVPPSTLALLPALQRLGMRSDELGLHDLPELPHLEVLSLKSQAIKDLQALQRFPHLRQLSLPDGRFGDLTPLSALQELEFLDISDNPSARYPQRLALPRLRHLKWDASQSARLTSAAFLAGCENLEALSLSGHALEDLEVLRRLGRLRVLDLDHNQVSDITALAALPALSQLNLAGNRVADVAPLAACRALTWLSLDGNPCPDLSPLGSLQRLEDLDISSTGVSDLAFVKRLRNLHNLKAGHNTIHALEPLLELPHLGTLRLAKNRIAAVTPEWLDGLPALESLELAHNPIGGIDVEVYSQDDGRKALRSLRDYFRGLQQGSVKHDQVKLLLVGNGRVGKTSVVSRLLDDRFDAEQPSTHGIQLRRWLLEHAADDKLDGRPLRVTVWDFGGQDIYHATHRLFMRTRALFLLVWDRQTEHQPYSLDEFGERYENFGLAYWLDYIQALSGSPVLVVQNKVDTLADKDHGHGLELQLRYPPPGGILDFLHVSARRARDPGMAALAERVRDALGSSTSIGFALPAPWVAVRDQLAQMTQRCLEWPDYVALCQAQGLVESQPQSLALFLHETGAVFYEPGQFGERLILDQKWAVDAIYALLDRRGAAYASLRAAGRHGLSLEILRNQVWRHFSADDHQLLLGFMLHCELCFELGRGRYYVPQLLPDDAPRRVRLRWAEAPPHALQIRYRFLHRAIVDRFLVRAGRLGADDEPEIWRNGIVVLDATGRCEALVEADAASGCITARAQGPGAEALLLAVKREFDALRQGFEASVWVSADAGVQWVDLQQLEAYATAGVDTVLAQGGQPVALEALRGFLQGAAAQARPVGLFAVSARSAIAARTDPARPEIFVSYAWGDPNEPGPSREAIVDRLVDRLTERGHRVLRDKKDLGYRGEISEFMHRLGRSQVVVAVISDKYLKSPYCMYEMLEIERHGGFRERVFPIVLADARLRTLADQMDYVRHWQAEKKKVEDLIRQLDPGTLRSDGLYGQYERYYRDVYNQLDKLIAILSNLNTLTPQLLEENSFERLLAEIEGQLAAAR
jgi:internalin A